MNSRMNIKEINDKEDEVYFTPYHGFEPYQDITLEEAEGITEKMTKISSNNKTGCKCEECICEKDNKVENKKFDITKPIQTKNGCKARILADDVKGGEELIIALVETTEGVECPFLYNKNGTLFATGNSKYDLINIHEEITLYTNVYRRKSPYSCNSSYAASYLYKNRKDADSHAGKHRIARVRITFEEGQFDE